MSLEKTLQDLHDIIEKAPIGIYTSTPQGRYIFANPALADSFGYASPEDLMDSITDITAQIYYDPADREEFMRLLERDGEVVNHECRQLRKDGTAFWASTNARVIKDEQGRIVAYQGFNQVITAEKQARDSVKEANQRLLTILDNVDFIVNVMDMESHELLFVNKFGREKLGVIEGQKCWETFQSGQKGPCRFCNNKDLLDDSGNATGVHRREFQNSRNNMWYDCHDMAVQWTDGRMVRLGISIDITKRKKAEQELHRQEDFLQAVFDSIQDGISVLDVDFNIVKVNRVMKKWYSHMLPLEGKKCFRAYHDRSQKCESCPAVRALKTGRLEVDEIPLVQKEGTTRMVEVFAFPLMDESGSRSGVVKYVRDITEGKKAKEDLAREKRLFKAILDNIPVMITRYDPHINMLYLNKEFNKIIGWQTEEVQDIDLMEKVYPDPEYRREVIKYMNQAVQEWRELTLRTKSGEINFSEWSNIRLADGTQVGIGIDITQHKQAEEEIRRIKSLLETAGRIARFGGWSVNLSDYKVYMSSQVAKIHEAPPDYSPTVEESIALYAPEWREKISGVFNRCATNGVPYDEEMEIITLKGRRIWIRTTGEAIRDEAGVIRQVDGAFQDITEQKKIHEALKASLTEKEMLLREVHHRVKNNLAIISALLGMGLEEVEDPAASALLSDLGTRIRSIALVHGHLYQNENLARVDFQDYLESLLQDLRFSLGEGKNIRYIALAGENTFGIDAAIPCGMIINELVTNAIKYAFPDGKAYDGQSEPEISVEVRKDNGHYNIMVADNGVGIPKEIDLGNSKSFGLRLVRMIGTHQLGGNIELERSPGTSVIFTFKPRHKENS